MADIKSSGDIKAGRDIQIADRGGKINQPTPPRKEGPISRLIRAIVDTVKSIRK